MEDRQAILKRVTAAAQKAGRWVTAFEELEEKTFERAYPLIRGWVLEKFTLEEADTSAADELMALADRSLRKILRLKKEGKLTEDLSRGCSGASSVITKKVLLMKAAQDAFRITLSPEESAQIQTVTDLTKAILSRRPGGENLSPRTGEGSL